VIGVNCLINVQHNKSGEKTYANVVSVMPLIKGMPKMVADGYVREESKDAAQHADTQQAERESLDSQIDASDATSDDDCPF
jgi:hypothetical protein